MVEKGLEIWKLDKKINDSIYINQIREIQVHQKNILFHFFFFFFFFAFSRAAHVAYGDSQARGLIGAVAARPTPEPQQLGIRAVSATYTTAHGNARSLTH